MAGSVMVTFEKDTNYQCYNNGEEDVNAENKIKNTILHDIYLKLMSKELKRKQLHKTLKSNNRDISS